MNTEKPSSKVAVSIILLVSALACAFLFWLIYFKPTPDLEAGAYAWLPALNALLNALSATALCIGIVMIKQGRQLAHKRYMAAAFLFSTLFLLCYIAHHSLHGDTVFPKELGWRNIYYGVLISHIILSIVALPLVLTTFYLSLSGRLTSHRKVAKITFPIWLYVSVTGVIIFVLLRLALG